MNAPHQIRTVGRAASAFVSHQWQQQEMRRAGIFFHISIRVTLFSLLDDSVPDCSALTAEIFVTGAAGGRRMVPVLPQRGKDWHGRVAVGRTCPSSLLLPFHHGLDIRPDDQRIIPAF